MPFGAIVIMFFDSISVISLSFGRLSPSSLGIPVTLFADKGKRRSEFSADSRNPLDPVTYKSKKKNVAAKGSDIVQKDPVYRKLIRHNAKGSGMVQKDPKDPVYRKLIRHNAKGSGICTHVPVLERMRIYFTFLPK